MRRYKKNVDQDKDEEDVSELEFAEVVSCNVIYSIAVISKHLKYYLLLC